MSADVQVLSFGVQVDLKPVPKEVFELGQMLKDDQEATLRERQLAWLVLKLASSINQLITDMETGTLNIVVSEKDFTR